MNDDRLRLAYERVVASRSPGSRAGCPAPEALFALAERTGNETERLATASHVATCMDCQRDLNLLRAVHATKPQALRRFTTNAAAAAILVVAGIPVLSRLGRQSPAGDVQRSGADIVLVAPKGDVREDRPLFVWKPVASAEQYEVTVVGADGSIPLRQTTRDTTLAAPASLAAGADYVWTVMARLIDGGERRSEPVSFRVVPRDSSR
jgi:hypothetical protein